MKRFIKTILLILFSTLGISSILWSEPYLGTKSPEEPKNIGDIVFNDGSATPYKTKLKLSDEQKAAAIAVIFYTGTDCSDDGKNRTLGLGLQYSQNRLQYCELQASSRFESIDTIYDTTKNGSKNLNKIGEWLKEHNKIDDTDNSSKYPAFYYAINYNEYTTNLNLFSSDWYLPSKAEFEKIFKKKKIIDAVCKLCEVPLFKNAFYWTATQSHLKNFNFNLSANAFIISFKDGYCLDQGTDKNNVAYACSIKEF